MFIKSVWVKGLIEKNAKVATEDALKSWVDLAKLWLNKSNSSSADLLSQSSSSVNKAIELKDEEQSSPLIEQQQPTDIDINSSKKTDGFLDIMIDIPGINIPLPAKIILLVSVLFTVLICCGFLFSHIYTLEHEVYLWEQSTEELHDRLLFLQVFTSYLLTNINADENLLQSEWEYWQKTRGLDWRLAEWQDQMFVLQNQLSDALHEVSHILEMVSDTSASNEQKLLNERRLKSLIAFMDDSKV